MFRDLIAGIRDIVGGCSASYEEELRRVREVAFAELEENGLKLQADAGHGAAIRVWTPV